MGNQIRFVILIQNEIDPYDTTSTLGPFVSRDAAQNAARNIAGEYVERDGEYCEDMDAEIIHVGDMKFSVVPFFDYENNDAPGQ